MNPDAAPREGATTQAEAPPEVSPVPPAFYWSAWIGVFAVLTWGMMHLFGSHRAP